jgi:hypothetical protein
LGYPSLTVEAAGFLENLVFFFEFLLCHIIVGLFSLVVLKYLEQLVSSGITAVYFDLYYDELDVSVL